MLRALSKGLWQSVFCRFQLFSLADVIQFLFHFVLSCSLDFPELLHRTGYSFVFFGMPLVMRAYLRDGVCSSELTGTWVSQVCPSSLAFIPLSDCVLLCKMQYLVDCVLYLFLFLKWREILFFLNSGHSYSLNSTLH